MSQCCRWPGRPPIRPSARSWTVSWAQRCRDHAGGAETPPSSRGSIFLTSTTIPGQGTQEAPVHICAIMCLSVGVSWDKKFQEASGNGNRQAAREGREATDRPSPPSPTALPTSLCSLSGRRHLPRAPWQMSVRVAPPTINWGSSQISWGRHPQSAVKPPGMCFCS